MPTDEALRARIRAKPGTWLVTGAAGFIGSNLRAATVADPAAVNQFCNIALGEMTTLSQLYATLRELLAPRYLHLRDSRPEHRGFRPGDVPLSQADIGKAMRLLGYRPQWRLREGLARAIDWYAGRPPAAAGDWSNLQFDMAARAASRPT